MFINKPQEFGWIKLHRKILSKGYYKKSEYVHLWIHLLLKANHKPIEITWNGNLIIIKEGQLLTGRKSLSEETGISESTIERVLNLLQNEQQIKQEKTTKFRIITINNWEEYQGGQQADNKISEPTIGKSLNLLQNEQQIKQEKTTKFRIITINNWEEYQGGQQADNKRTTNGQQTDTNKNNKNDKNDKNNKEGSQMKSISNDYFLDLLPIDSTQQFIDAWVEWVDFRKEIRKKLTKSTANKQISFLNTQPNPIGCINQSIKNGWTGLFEERQNGTKPSGNRRKDYVTKDEYESELKSLYEGGAET